MRITGPKRSSQVSTKAKTGGSAAASGSFSVSESGGANAAASAGSVRSLTAVDALISIQEVPDATARRAKAIARAENILEMLEEIKIALLSGALPRSRVTKLTRLVEEARGVEADADLSGVLDEIDLRARVELAKLENAA